MKRLAVAALLLAVAGCSDSPTSPSPPAVDGSYSVVGFEGVSSLGVPAHVDDGVLVLEGGSYSLSLLWQAHPDYPANLHEQAGEYAVSGDTIYLERSGLAVADDGGLTHQWSGRITIRWAKD